MPSLISSSTWSDEIFTDPEIGPGGVARSGSSKRPTAVVHNGGTDKASPRQKTSNSVALDSREDQEPFPHWA